MFGSSVLDLFFWKINKQRLQQSRALHFVFQTHAKLRLRKSAIVAFRSIDSNRIFSTQRENNYISPGHREKGGGPLLGSFKNKHARVNCRSAKFRVTP